MEKPKTKKEILKELNANLRFTKAKVAEYNGPAKSAYECGMLKATIDLIKARLENKDFLTYLKESEAKK